MPTDFPSSSAPDNQFDKKPTEFLSAMECNQHSDEPYSTGEHDLTPLDPAAIQSSGRSLELPR
jgi:hypothetical protein